MDVKGSIIGKCHCGNVEFEIELPKGFEELSRCNCSLCARRGAVVTSVPLSAFKILKGADQLRHLLLEYYQD